KEYPLCRVSVSSASHPFFTKATQFMDTEGRVDKFTKKYQRKTAEVKLSQDKRSEEHTSELQSQSNLVCRLLLEKKKKKKTQYIIAIAMLNQRLSHAIPWLLTP